MDYFQKKTKRQKKKKKTRNALANNMSTDLIVSKSVV